MSLEIKIPAVGESITSGLLSTWHKQDGENVARGDILLTLETDKVSTELTAEGDGVLRIQVQAGEEVKIGAIVGSIEEGAAGAPSAAKPEEKPVAPLSSPPAQTPAPAHTMPPAAVVPATTKAASPAPSASAPQQPSPAEGAAALREAIATANQTLEVPAQSESTAPAAVGEERSTRKRMSPIRRKIAAQLVSAQQTSAILTTFNECDMSAVMKLRTELQESFTKEHGLKLGFMSFFVKAVVNALKATPMINARIDGDDLILNHYYDIGVAVGTEKGLVVPVIRDADKKSFADIERDIASYAVKARENKIKIEDLQGGVFTISNGGIYGSLLSTPILNPPQSGILGMHKIQERPMAVKGQVVILPMMYLALSYDHRVVDGKEAVTFLVRVKDCLENPARLLLDL